MTPPTIYTLISSVPFTILINSLDNLCFLGFAMECESDSSRMLRLVVSKKRVFSCGTDSEVFNIENVKLSLMGCCYDLPTANIIRTEEFSLRVAMLSISSILIMFSASSTRK
ncbi:hypothetical protein NE237_025052 [Protea cynaroides]|uniref:Uncharacterized protein n=1 Tax=Protea cynaroides TaxID=273540 RepID=A0A9Q0H3F2_9MAGN|nr:hypothetical protein NE237_025052 [Protea cynaroides]